LGNVIYSIKKNNTQANSQLCMFYTFLLAGGNLKIISSEDRSESLNFFDTNFDSIFNEEKLLICNQYTNKFSVYLIAHRMK
jgi:hypothetical protein